MERYSKGVSGKSRGGGRMMGASEYIEGSGRVRKEKTDLFSSEKDTSKSRIEG